MEINLESLRQVFIVLINDQSEEYYFDYKKWGNIGKIHG